MALVLTPEAPAEAWLAVLDEQIRKAPSFFDGRPVVVDLAALPREQPDVAGLIRAMQHRGIRIIGTEGAHPSWAGLEAWGPPLAGGRAGAKPADMTPPVSSAPPVSAPSASAVIASASGAPGAATLVVAHPVRSGQSVISEKGDVVIVGSVASGAEVMAGGSIHVYGALRGRAVAGMAGNPAARIFCRKLEAELLAIDGLYRTADDVEPALRGRAVQAWLDGQVMKLDVLD